MKHSRYFVCEKQTFRNDAINDIKYHTAMIKVSPAYTTVSLHEKGPGEERSSEDSACAKGRKNLEN